MSPGRLGHGKRASGEEEGTGEALGCRTRGLMLWEATAVTPSAPCQESKRQLTEEAPEELLNHEGY